MPASITATTTTPCPCCGTCEPATLQCRVRSGTVTICGHSEYTSPSTPPRKYLTQTASGGEYWCGRSGGGCTGSYTNQSKNVYAGTFVYNASTCATTNTQTKKFYGDGAAGSCTGDAPTLYSTDAMAANWAPGFIDAGPTLTTTPTNKTWDFSGVCAYGASFNGTAASDLTDEDVESAAISRFNAANAFGSWTNSGAGGCTGTPPSCCLAKYESRTSGFSFAYAEAEARVTATGLTPSTLYTAKIELYRRTYGSGTYVLYQTVETTGTSDGGGNLTTGAITVTNTKGYETYAYAGCVVKY